MRKINLLEFFIKVSLDDEVTSKLSKVTNAVGNGLATAAKIGTAAVVAAGTAVTALATQSVEAFADFEQLAGGVTTLFGDAANAVFAYSEEAFKNAGLSANEYMETVTSFSASLIQSLNGDTAAAADVANRAITDMSDNANKMGTSMESIQNAYQGFAKQNYTMLDNLKLGYGGTKEEMERLIQDAAGMTDAMAELGISVDATDMSFANIVNAISVVQTNLGITGTTAKEAATTIQGSLSMTKSAWENMLTAMAGGTEDFTLSFDNALDSLLTSAETFFDNVKPRVIKAIEGIGTAITKLTPKLAELLPEIADGLLPSLVKSVTELIEGASGVIPTIITVITENLPTIMEAGISILSALGHGLLDNIELIVSSVVSVIEMLTKYISENADKVTDGAVTIILTLAEGLLDALPDLLAAVPTIFAALVKAIIGHLPDILALGVKIIQSLIEGIFSVEASLVKSIGEVLDKVKQTIKDSISNAKQWGKDLLQNFIDGIKSKISALGDALKTTASKIKSILGFSEPEDGPLSNFHTYAPDMMKLFAKGIRDNEDLITGQLEKSFDFGSVITSSQPATVSNISSGIGTVNITINGANYSDETSLAEAIMEQMQTLVDRRNAVYA